MMPYSLLCWNNASLSFCWQSARECELQRCDVLATTNKAEGGKSREDGLVNRHSPMSIAASDDHRRAPFFPPDPSVAVGHRTTAFVRETSSSSRWNLLNAVQTRVRIVRLCPAHLGRTRIVSSTKIVSRRLRQTCVDALRTWPSLPSCCRLRALSTIPSSSPSSRLSSRLPPPPRYVEGLVLRRSVRSLLDSTSLAAAEKKQDSRFLVRVGRSS